MYSLRPASDDRPLPTLIVISGALFLVACAAQSPPQPPRVEQPEQIRDLAVVQIGRSIEISFTLPHLATDGERLTKPLEIEFFRTITAPGQKPPNNPAASTPWINLKGAELARDTRGETVHLTRRFSEEELNSWRGATLTFAARALTRGFRHHPVPGALSKPVETTLLDVSGPVEDLRITSTEKALELHWSKPQGMNGGSPPPTLSGYRIYRSTTGKPASDSWLAETASTNFADRDFEFGRTYSFIVRAVFREGRQVAESEDAGIEITPHDVFPPAAPTGLSGIYTGVAVELVWTANSEPDLAGYNVYRREGETPPVRINRELVYGPIFRDTNVQTKRKYVYHVTAIDLSNNESPSCEEVAIETR